MASMPAQPQPEYDPDEFYTTAIRFISPLDSTTATVRLLRISRGTDASIHGKLEDFPLDGRECPPFFTLSYVWGTPVEARKEIMLNGQRFLVMQNLYLALRAICDTPMLSPHWWWIDAICINQGSYAEAALERASQIHLMGRIYTQSERTIGWLGEASGQSRSEEGVDEGPEDGEEAMRFLQLLLKNRWRLDSEAQRDVVQELSDRAKWANLQKFFHRPWWRRVWTLQEYIIPRDFVFFCGTEWMTRDDFKVATYSIYLCREIDKTLLRQEAFDPVWNRRRLYMWRKEVLQSKQNPQMSLVALMAYVSDCQATNSRDRIYSLLGLAGDGEIGDLLDYNWDINKTYSEFVKVFVEQYKSLDIICFVHTFHEAAVPEAATTATQSAALPSWVPDWRATAKPWVVPVMASQGVQTHIGNFRPTSEIKVRDDAALYAAAGTDHPTGITFSDDLRLLTCKGIFVDFVDGIGGLRVFRHGDVDGEKDVLVEEHAYVDSTSLINNPAESGAQDETLHIDQIDPEKCAEIMDDIWRCLVLDRKDRYLTYPAPADYFSGDFRALYLKATAGSPDVHRQFFDWFQLNKTLSIKGHSLEEWCKGAEKVDRSHLEPSNLTAIKSFESRFNDTTQEMARRLITTDAGYVGMAPCRARKGDRVCVLLGCSIPLVLRRREDDAASSYEVIGECYLHGFMNGEVLQGLERGKFEIGEVRLS